MSSVKEYHILSLGAGVQSTMLALLSHLDLATNYVPKFDYAIFADTQEEPDAVYSHLEWLIKETSPSFPTLIRTAGKLGDDLVHGIGEKARFAAIPAYTAIQEGQKLAIAKRQCSSEYKVNVVEKTIKRDILGIKPYQRIPDDVVVHQYAGLSFDEGYRIFGRNGKPGVKSRIESATWRKAHFPLYDMFLSRGQIEHWLVARVPHKTPRSACTFCPFHSDKEWQDIRDKDPKGWQRSIEIDEALRNGAAAARGLDQTLYLHKSCIPLKDVVLNPKSESANQGELNFSALECEGMCGL